MVKITLEYGSVEEAIQALGKLSGLAKVRRAATATGAAPSVPSTGAAGESAQAPVTAAASTKTRKPRNDAGKPRGPHKKDAATDLAAAPATTAPVAEGVVGAAPEASTGPQDAQPVPVAAPSVEDAKIALEAYFDRHGPQKAMALLAGFGVSKLRELPAEKRAEFIKACEA